MNFVGKFGAQPFDDLGAHSDTHAHVEAVTASHVPPGAIIVPDAQLLFHGDFKRAGVDLILSKDDHELVLHDYFKGEKRATLASPDGAHLTGDLVNTLSGHVEYAQADGSASAGKIIGHVTKLTGTATAVRNGVSIVLNQGDNVEKGDLIQSGSGSTVGITFIDGTVFGLSSNAKMVLNEMVYDPNGSNNSSLLSLVAGTISFVAGETAKHGDMKVDTPVATMGIRGTAVLVEIDFDVPGQGGAPDAKFQVLVEPDGTTGSYILYDKTTLAPIATVNQAGQQIHISQGVVSQTATGLSADVQKLITEVFAQKFTDNTNTKTFDHFTDTPIPVSLTPIMLANKTIVTPIVELVAPSNNSPAANPNGPTTSVQHINQAPTVVTFNDSVVERAGVTHSSATDTVSSVVRFVDINAGDLPTVKTTFGSFTYQNAQHTDVTATLSALQIADITAVEATLTVVQAAGNNNNGSATWTYNITDGALDFLAAGETLTLTYVAEVDSNYAPNNLKTFETFTITITGTNDTPVITTGPESVAYAGGQFTPGGNLPTVAHAPTTGTLAFTDVDLTDTHTVSAKLTDASMSGPGATTLDMAALDALAPAPMAAFEQALTAKILAGNDSTGSGSGTINWQLADLPVYLADFIPDGETLTLTYTVTVTDSQNAISKQTVTVTITGTAAAAVVWIDTAPVSPSGALWSDKSNWETGTVPTASDDAIIITDQLAGLTPSYPVTINAPAFAKSLTMNDFGGAPTVPPAVPSPPDAPVLINQSTLTIGGAVNLNADSDVENSGTIIVGGLMEVLDASVLNNSGQITLQQGGDFKTTSTITNTSTGTIEVSGGTLNVQVGIANAGHVTVDSAATLVLNGAAIDGGTVTTDAGGILDLTGSAVLKNGSLGNSGKINVSGIGNTLDHETVTSNHALEILAGGALTVDQLTTIANGGGTITVDGTATLTLNGATITGGMLANAGTINSTGTNSISNAAITNTGTIESTSGTLTIDPVVVVTLTNSGTLEANGGELDITSEPVTNTGTLQATDNSILKLTTTTVTNTDGLTNGTVTVDAGSTLDLISAILADGTLTNHGMLNATGTSAITNVGIANTNIIESTGGDLTISSTGGVTVTNSGTLEANGGELDITGEPVTNTGTLQAAGNSILKLTSTTVTNTDGTTSGTVNIDAGSTLDLISAILADGTLTNHGTLNATGTSAITDVGITNTNIIESTGGDLTISSSAAGVTLTNSGTLEANGGELDITSEPVTNTGTLQAADNSTLKLTTTKVTNTDGTSSGTVSVDAGSTLDLISAILADGTLTNHGTLNSTGTSAITDVGITNTNIIESTGGDLTISSTGGVTLTNSGTLEANGGELDITSEPVTNTGTLQAIGNSILKLTTTTVTNTDGTTSGTVSVDAGSTLDLISAILADGTLTNHGTLNSTGTSAITDAGITNTGTIESTGGTLTIDPATVVTLTNSGTLEANGGELDITGEPVTNTGTLQAINGGTLKLSSMTVTNTDGTTNGTVTIGSGSVLDLAGAGISGGTLGNAGTIDNLSGNNVISAAVDNTGTIEVAGGSLDLTGGLSGTGGLIIDAGATLELAGANAENVTFSGGTGTLQLDNALGFTGTIAGVSSTGGTFEITGAGSVTSLSGDAIDFTASGGVVGSTADVTLTPGGTVTGAANGIVAIQNGVGDLTVDPSGNVIGQAGDGVVAEDSATGIGNIIVHGSGSVTGTGAGSVGLLAENLNAANAGDITVTQLDGASGGAYGIEALSYGSGNVTVEAGGAVTGTTADGIRALSFGSGDILVTLDAGSTLTSGSAGIVAVNQAAAVPSAAVSSITVNAYGTINSGAALVGTGNPPAGILAGYLGGTVIPSASPLTNVNGNVTVNNYADITAAAGDGIRAYNYGVGDVTVNDDAGTITALGGTNPTNGFGVGIGAYNFGSGNTSVTTAAGTVIHSGGSGIEANNGDATAPSTSQVYVLAHGTITSGTIDTSDGKPAAGILAGYNYNSAADGNAHGNVVIDDYASITAAAGTDGIRGYNYGNGTVTITAEAGAEITAGRYGLAAIGNDDGNVSVTNYATVSAATAIRAMTGGAGTATIDNYGAITGAVTSYNATFTNESGAIWNLTGSSVLTGTSTIENAGTIDTTLAAGGTLGDGTAHVTLTNDLDGVIDATKDTLTLDTGNTIANAGLLEATATGTLLIDDRVTNTGTLQAIGTSTLKLTSTVTNTGADGTVTVGSGSTLVLVGATIADGTLTNRGTIDIEAGASSPASTLDGVAVTGVNAVTGSPATPASTIKVGATSAATLLLEDATTVTAGTLTIGSGSTLDIEAGANGPGATLDGVSVTGVDAATSPATAGSTIEVGATSTATLTLDDGTTITGGTLTIGANGTVEIASGLNDIGATLDGVTVNNSGAIDIGSVQVQGIDPTLTLDDGTMVTGGTLAIGSGDTLDIEHGASGPGATLDGVAVSATDSTGTIVVGSTSAATLLLDDGTSITQGTLTIGSGSTLDVEHGAHGPGATLDGVSVTGIDAVTGPSAVPGSTIEIGVSGAATLTLDDGTSITGGAMTIGSQGVLDVTHGSVTLSDIVVSNSGTIQVDTGATLHIDANVNGVLEANGGTLVIGANAVTTDATVTITDGGSVDFVGSSTQTLTLNVTLSGSGTLELDNSQHYGGTITGFGAGTTIDLNDLKYSPDEIDSWNSDTGTLTITDGTQTTSLHFTGSFTQDDFALAQGACGITELVWSPAQASLTGLDSDHNAVAGSAVAISFSDPAACNVSYQWFDNGVAILGATGSSYTPVTGDQGSVLDVVVNFTDGGNTEHLTELAGTVAAAPVVSVSSSYLTFNGNGYAAGPLATTQIGNGANDGVTLAGWVDWSGQGNIGDYQNIVYNGSTSDAGFGLLGNVTANGLDLIILVGGISIVDTGITLAAGQSHNVALTHVNGDFTLYVDGHADYTVQVGANSMPGPAHYPDSFVIGGDADGENFTGSIGEVSVWNAALTQSQIQALESTSPSGGETNLAAYYPLNDGSGTTAADLVNSAGNLTLSGNPTWGTNSTTNDNAPLTLSGIEVSFADAGSDIFTTTLDVNHGTLSLGSVPGVSESGLGTTSSPLILTGTLAAIDAALGGIVYTPTVGYAGTDTLSVVAQDGAINSNTATVNINVLGPVATSFTLGNTSGPTSGGWSYDPENGHYYKYVADGTDWSSAMAAAAVDEGAYLATVTSGAENVFVSGVLPSGKTAWTGGQSTDDPASGRPQFGSVPFTWFDGPETGTLFTYASWNNDNLPPGGGEPTGGFDTNVEALQVGSNGQWNDVPSTWDNSQGGYVEEFGGLTGQVAFTENTSTDIATSVLLVNDTDTFGGTLTVTAIGAAGHGTVTLNGDVISYNPDIDYSGTDSFTYTISDGTYSSTGTVSFDVAAVPTLTWNASSTGDWTTSTANWSTGAAPVSADDVTINAGGAPYTVTIANGETASAQMLTLDNAAATLVDAGSLTLTGDLAVDAGTFELQGGSLQSLSITVAADATFSGYGTVAGPVAITGTVEAHGGNLDFAGYVTGNGTFTIDAGATLEFDGLVSTGSVVSFAASTGTLIIEQSASFQGEVSGTLASGDVLDLRGLLSNGDIVATQAGDTFQTSASYDSVHGTTLLTVTDETHGQSTFLTLAGNYSTATWSATSDGHGGVDIVDPPAAPSSTVASGGSLEIGNSVASTETVTFQGSTGSLTLDTPSSFHGTIAGFTGDGTLQGSDHIDLRGIDYHSSAFAESFNASTDTLSITDGTESATLHFTGSYVAANFSFTTDGNGGTIVYDPPANPPAVPAKTAAAAVASETSHGFVFNFANAAGHDAAPDFHPGADGQHPMPANAQTALGLLHDDGHGNLAIVPDGHDHATLAGIIKAQFHADFHFV